tara:strand:- start:238 stop:852 length:615 start_codon:yes stop_codon:yes gene_type:complete
MGLISDGSIVFDAGAMGAGFGGALVFIKKLTASNSATLSFVNGASSVVLDTTYKEYLFTLKNIHAGTDDTGLTFNVSIDGGTNYNVAKTTTFFRATHGEDGSSGAIAYVTGADLAQGTGFSRLDNDMGSDNDQCMSGVLSLYNPGQTSFVKHFISRTSVSRPTNRANDVHTSGYANTTTAINAVQFKMNSGNIGSGDICLYGIG